MKPKGKMMFLHHKINREVILYWEKNDLNGSMMWWFDITNAMYAGTMKDLKSWIKNIKSKCEIIDDETWER
jgi:hypothetical protein